MRTHLTTLREDGGVRYAVPIDDELVTCSTLQIKECISTTQGIKLKNERWVFTPQNPPGGGRGRECRGG